MCRPLICEPDLPRRWLEDRGSSSADCIACNSCIYHMIVNVERGTPQVTTCVFKVDKRMHRTAQRWLAAWVRTNVTSRPVVDSVPACDSEAI